jgi:hypothetical protein
VSNTALYLCYRISHLELVLSAERAFSIDKMAPLTRAKASKPQVAPAGAPAAPKQTVSEKPATSKTRESAAAVETSSSKVQKKKKSSPKKKGKGRSLSPEVPDKSPSRASPKPSPKAASQSPPPAKSSPKVPSKQKKAKKALRSASPAANQPVQDQDYSPELAQAYGIFAHLDQPQTIFSPRSPRFIGGQVLRPDEHVLMARLAQHMVNPPAWSPRPGTAPIRGFRGPLPRGFELAGSPPPSAAKLVPLSREGAAASNGWTEALNEAAGKSSGSESAIYDRRRREAKVVKKRPSSIVGNIVRQVREQLVASPRIRKSARRTSHVVGDIVAQVEAQRPESPVSIRNAQVFNRPTVAHVRRERGQLHDELRDWVQRLRRARDDFDGVIGEIEGRMQILKAVNEMQTPLRKAVLGRGR